ncbi:MAG: glycoside hydrolase family 15 protein [Myxococcaceae bacterium]
MSNLPIADYALISDCHSAALVSRHGSVDWLCFPRFDSPSVFARLLDEEGGHFSIRAAGETAVSRRYQDRTLILETTFRTPTGTAVLLDGMAVGRNERGHELGADAPHALLRQLRCTAGTVELELEYAPRPEYGLVLPLLTPLHGGISGRGGAHVLFLTSPVPVEIDGSVARARLRLGAGDAMGFAVEHRTTDQPSARPWSQREIEQRLDDTAEAWRTWSDHHQGYDGPWKELVQQSGVVLQGLTYYPTGAICAAATTSLPEEEGGIRNWDYRFTWVRDASLTLDALWIAACPDEAHRYFDFLTGAALTQIRRGADLQIMFGIGGEHDLSERELPHLSGWRNSRPVRIGNGAWSQRQLDVYGELMGAVDRLREQLRNLDPTTRHFLVEVVETAGRRWTEKDQGIWEVRGPPRDFLYSKLMCWVALHRGIMLADLLEARERVEGWRERREQIRTAILERGWSDRAQAFTQTFGSDDLDASNLMLPIVGFLPGDDPRMVATIDAIASRLTDEHGLVYRYRADDGLEGEEGTFLLCTFWLAQAQALAGQLERATATFSRAAGYANDLGLLAEEVDPRNREFLGNFPQAFSHIGLINAAWTISQALEHRRAPGEIRPEVLSPMEER